MNAIEFDYAIKKRGLTRHDICKMLGITPSALSLKLKGKTGFRQNQLVDLFNNLKLSPEEFSKIFLQKQSTKSIQNEE